MTKISISFLEILMNIIKVQNDQLLKIICEEEDIDIQVLKKLRMTTYKIKQGFSGS